MGALYLYVVSAAPNPEQITCTVPYRIDTKEIFFGPCKKRLRSGLRKNFLAPTKTAVAPEETIYLVGVNGGNRRRIRQIVWAGQIAWAHRFLRSNNLGYVYRRKAKPSQDNAIIGSFKGEYGKEMKLLYSLYLLFNNSET